MKNDEKIFELAEPMIIELGFELVDVEYVKEKDEKYLRVYIDKPEGVTIDDCQLVSGKLGMIIDEKNIIDESYIFEVSSPGLERVLKKDREFERYCGELIEVKLYKAINGQKIFQGYLKKYDKGSLYLEIEGEEKEFDRKDIAIAKRAFIF